MKRYRNYTLLMLIMLVGMWGCQSGGKLRIHNSTSHPLYAGVGAGVDVMIPAGQEHVFEIGTDSQSIITGEVKKTISLRMIGETYNIWDDWANRFTDTTFVTIKAGKTLSAYIQPNRACIKVINNSGVNILQADIFKNTYTGSLRVGTLSNISSGTTQFKRVEFAAGANVFSYQVTLNMEDGNVYTYGDQTNLLHIDEVYVVTLNDPEDHVKTGYSK